MADVDALSDQSDDYMSGSDDENLAKGHSKQKVKKAEVFYTEGTQELKEARLEIAKYSLPKAQKRLEAAKARRDKSIREPSLES